VSSAETLVMNSTRGIGAVAVDHPYIYKRCVSERDAANRANQYALHTTFRRGRAGPPPVGAGDFPAFPARRAEATRARRDGTRPTAPLVQRPPNHLHL
jgi:hypothetical protein